MPVKGGGGQMPRTGSVVVGATTYNFTNNTGGTESLRKLDIPYLGFIPKVIFVFSATAWSMMTKDEKLSSLSATKCIAAQRDGTGFSIGNYAIQVSGNCKNDITGISIPVYFAETYTYIAYPDNAI